MRFVYSTGGREKYFKALNVGDCVTRAIANATGKDYLEVYNDLKELAKHERKSKHFTKSSVRDGVRKTTDRKYIESLGWKWISTCRPGEGVSMHLTEDELPSGTLIVAISKHLTCVKDKTIYDTYDCSKKSYWTTDEFGERQLVTNNKRAVYGYFVRMSDEELKAIKEQNEHAQKVIEYENKCIAETKAKAKAIEDKYQKELKKYIAKEKFYHHKRVLLENKIKREIDAMKKEDGQKCCEGILDGKY